MQSFMRETDAFSWYMERDAVLRANVVAVAWLDRSPPWEWLRAKVDTASRLVPSFRQRLVELPARLTTPRWVVDDGFDLDWHLRRFGSPVPHGPETVLDVARHEAMSAFDRSRPLWEFTLIENLEGGRAALVLKIHHSLTDGVGGMELALRLFDRERGTSPDANLPEPPSPERLDSSALLRDALLRNGRRLSDAVTGGIGLVVPSAAHSITHPFATIGNVLETVRSIGRTVAPVRQTLSPIMTRRGLGRRVDMVEVRLSDLKRAAAFGGGTVNDAFMAAATGALRRYHERHGAPVASLRVTLPISIRTPDDPLGGNRITLMRFVVPVSELDPARRMAEIHERCRTARHERSLAWTDAIAGTLSLLPSGVVGSMLKRVDFLASDVPGMEQAVYLGDALVERFVSFSPTAGSSVNVTLMSYNGLCCIGVNADTAAVPDAEVFTQCLLDGFEEVLALAGMHDPARRSWPCTGLAV